MIFQYKKKTTKPQLKEMKKLPKNGEQKIAPCFFLKKKKARISFNCMLSTMLYADDKLSFQVREISFKMPSRIS